MEDNFSQLKKTISDQKELVKELNENPSKETKEKLKTKNNYIEKIVSNISLNKQLDKISNVDALKEMKLAEKDIKKEVMKKDSKEDLELEGEIMRRLKKQKRIMQVKKEEKVSPYVTIANKLFAKMSLSLYKNNTFGSLKEDLIKANLPYLPVSYISTIFLTTIIAGIISIFIFLFFMFFSLSFKIPFIISYNGTMSARIIKTIWIVLLIPLGTFFIMLIYPSTEKNYIKNKINQELPFVAIHMSAVAGSKIEPSKIFEIITLTKEYPFVSRELTKIINEINIYGSNLIGAIRKTALNTSSYKLAELLNGIATTATSGGSLDKFFEKKAQSLLFEYRLEREKYNRMAETFMDIYISVVIAAPMILMLLLMMIKVTGLGIQLTTQDLTLIVVGAVSFVNVIFITFLYLKQPES